MESYLKLNVPLPHHYCLEWAWPAGFVALALARSPMFAFDAEGESWVCQCSVSFVRVALMSSLQLSLVFWKVEHCEEADQAGRSGVSRQRRWQDTFVRTGKVDCAGVAVAGGQDI